MLRWSLIACLAALAACAPSRKEPAPVVYRGTAPAGAAQAPAETQTPPAAATAELGVADARGVVLYDGYETIRASRGDTVAAMAARAGLSASELAAYNGLSTQYEPEEGDELVLPARADRYQGARVAAAPAANAPANAGAQSGGIPTTYQPSAPAPGEAAASAPQSAPQSAPANGGSGWSAALARAAIDEAPPEGAAPAAGPETVAAPAPAPAPEPAPAPTLEPVQETPAATTPQPTVQTLPAADPQPAPTPAPAQPQTETALAAPAPEPQPVSRNAGQFARPSPASVARPFSRTPGPERNDGVDFATAAGDPVAAAGPGTVALISKSLGGLGTIVLIRHDNQFLTVYGRLGSVTVKKGEKVQRGQVIATVADLREPRKPYLHFEVRKGAESVDPMQYF